MQKEPKFKIGNIVRHKATQRHSSRKMLIMAVGFLKTNDGETIIYQVSAEKESYAPRDDSFFRTIMEEVELELFDN